VTGTLLRSCQRVR